MKALVYKYEAWEKQNVCFRGYVKKYRETSAVIVTCKVVRNNYAAAERDAKKLMKDIELGKTVISE